MRSSSPKQRGLIKNAKGQKKRKKKRKRMMSEWFAKFLDEIEIRSSEPRRMSKELLEEIEIGDLTISHV